MRRKVIPIAIAVVATLAVACGYKKASEKTVVICDQEYALCTSAQCIPDPFNPETSVCFCKVHRGKSLGMTACSERLAKTDHYGLRHLISTYSFEQLGSKELMTCPSGMPWSNCHDQPCIVNPLDPTQALCTCSVVHVGNFQTFGGECDTSTCAKGFWSGATPEANAESTKHMMRALGLTHSPQRTCPK